MRRKSLMHYCILLTDVNKRNYFKRGRKKMNESIKNGHTIMIGLEHQQATDKSTELSNKM